MRSSLQTILTGMLTATLMVDPAAACHYCGGGEVYVSPCSGCGGPCEVVEVAPAAVCCTIGAGRGMESRSTPAELPAPTPAATQPQRMGGEILVPPEVPPTHRGKPLQIEAPAVEPEPAPPAEGAEDLFSSPPAESAPAEDLFGPSDQGAPAEQPPAQPTEQPAEQPPAQPTEQPSAPAENGGFEGLFGAPAEEESTEPAAPAEEPAPAEEEKKEDSSFEDLFGQTDEILQEAGGLASTGLRRWVDNTGEYSCRGRLIDVADGHVKLLKDNGRTTTVALVRLSSADLNFVHRQASAQRASVDRTVLVTPARPTH